jgi:hypothetical protein
VKKLSHISSCITVAILVTCCSSEVSSKASYGANLLKNGGFEVLRKPGLPDGWQVIPAYEGKGTAAVDKTNKHDGQYSLKLAPSKKNTSDTFGVFQMLDAAELKGKQVNVSGFVRTDDINGAAAVLLDTGLENWLALPSNTGKAFVSFDKTFVIPKQVCCFLFPGQKGASGLMMCP